MKRCPFCAEEIQDAAVVCRHCGRVLGPLPARDDEPAGLARVLRGAELALGVGTVALVSYLLLGSLDLVGGARLPGPATDSARAAPPPPAPPQVIPVTELNLVRISPGDFRDFPFAVDDPRPCRLTGRVVGLSGGSRSVDVLVMDDDAFLNWRGSDSESGSVYERARTAAVTLDVPLPRPGRYHLVISNTFSVFTSKVVRVEPTRVTCGAAEGEGEPAA